MEVLHNVCVLRCVERRLFNQISFVVSSAWIRCVCFATFVAWDVYTPEDYITWNTTMEVLKILFLSKWMICRFHVNLPGCISVFFSSWVWWCQRSWYLQHKNDQLSKVAPQSAGQEDAIPRCPAGWGMGMFYYRISKWVDSSDTWIRGNRHLTHLLSFTILVGLFWWDVSHISFIALSSNLFTHYTCACVYYIQ